MKKITFALILFALFSISFNAQTKKRPVGKIGTVRVKAPPIPKNPPKEIEQKPKTLGITVEKYVVNRDVNRDGTAVETWEMQQRFDSDLVLERFKKFEREFNGDLQKAEILDAYILKGDGKKIALASEAMQIKPTPQAEAAPSFSSLKQMEIQFNDLKVGDATYFKIRLTTLKPYFDKHFDMLEVFPLTFNWKSVEVNLTAPADFPVFVQTVDLDGGRLPDADGRARWQWRKENLSAFEIEAAMFDFYNSSPRLAVSSFKNFDDLGAAYWAETKKKAIVTPEVQTLADEITKDIKEPAQQAAAIYEWVNKNIRYLSIVLDKGGWIPHSTTEILANRYGDCKDYSTIIHALLKAKNIESHPVLIRSEMGDWFPEVAAPDYFNHAILYIPSLKLFADATAPNTRLGLLTQSVIGKKAILAGEKTGVIEMPKDNPADNQLLSEVEINFAADGSLKAVSKNIYDGRAEIAYRPMFADSSLQRNSGDFVKMLLAFYGVNGSGKIVKVGNPFKVGEPFTVELEVEMPDFTTFTPRGTMLLPIAVNMMNTSQLEQFVNAEQRKTNLVLGATRFRENFTLNFPEGVKVETLPPTVNFTNSVGSYRNEFTLEAGSVKVLRELVINKDIVAAKDYPLVRELIKKSVDGANAELRYSANPLFARQKSREMRRASATPNKPVSISSVFSEKYDEKPLTAAQAAQLETKLQKTPGDLESRKKLLRYYTDTDADLLSKMIGKTPSKSQTKLMLTLFTARLEHRLWFVRNRPELDEDSIYGFSAPTYTADSPVYQTIRDEWLKQVEANKTNTAIRLNAADFMRFRENEKAEKLLVEGRQIDKNVYEFPLMLNRMLFYDFETRWQKEAAESNEETRRKQLELLNKAFENGETALVLLKKERSTDRDSKRRELLQRLAKNAFELEKLDRARSFATELILDFGQDADSPYYDEATHTGNIVLGRIALKENNPAKAKEYLLIAIRAPLRMEKNYLTSVDTALARELYAKGEKETVAEYLKLCDGLWNFKKYPKLYEDEIAALKLWQEQIKQGITPSFDFEKP